MKRPTDTARPRGPGPIGAFIANRHGAAIAWIALLMVPMAALMGLAAEVSSWLLMNRSMQNAADAAALAAATNGNGDLDSGSPPQAIYLREALTVAAGAGYVHGDGTTTVIASNKAECPNGSGPTCYQVTIGRTVPIFLVRVIGYRGNAPLGAGYGQRISATAIAGLGPAPASYCMLALATGNVDGIRSNGAPKANFKGCNLMSDANATCHGHDLGADSGNAAGTNDGCGVIANSNEPLVADPYAPISTHIPANPCGAAAAGYPQETRKAGLPASNQLSGGYTPASATLANPICGDVQLTGDVVLSGGNTTLVIENGTLDLNGFTLSTAAGAGVTIVFTGPTIAGLSPSEFPTGGGQLDIAAPKSGPWSGVAVYQDPALPAGSNVDVSYSGNSPSWNITGLVYLPNSDVTFSGAVGKANNGTSCFVLVVHTLRINGTGNMFSNPLSNCSDAGLTPPSGAGGSRMMLLR